MTEKLMNCKHLLLDQSDGELFITLNRPLVRNAMNLDMVDELINVFNAIRHRPDIRVVIMRGADGHFCAGGDIKDMVNAYHHCSDGDDHHDRLFDLNRRFGHLIALVNAAPHVVITLLQGCVLGGGFGLSCVSDIAIADRNAQFGLPETSLGVPPAQIAPFVVSRIGITQARRLVLSGARFYGDEARRMGLVHFTTSSPKQMHTLLQQQLSDIKRCAPAANRISKRIVLMANNQDLAPLLDEAARSFSAAVKSTEGQEGMTAFMEKRHPSWST